MKTIFKKNGGFTLVELIVVIAILAILGGVAVPAYSGYVAKANMQADITLAADVEKALTLAYYSGLFGEDFAGGSVILSTEGARVDSANANDTLATAMANTFGTGWEDLKLKYDGWTNTKADIKTTIAGSNFADENGNVNMELLGAVDNLTGQLGAVMDGGVLNLETVPDYRDFLTENGIDPSNSQLAANAAVLYLSQSSMPQESRDTVAKMLADRDTWEDSGFDLASSFMGPLALQGTCTQFESLAMVYATMQGYCMQKDRENGDTAWSDRFAEIDLTTMADGQPVFDETQVLYKLCGEFATMVDEDDSELFYEYLENNAEKDINAYYGVIDGISENQDYLKENLNGSDNFYSSQKNFLTAYWNANFNNGELCVLLYPDENGQWMADTRGTGE